MYEKVDWTLSVSLRLVKTSGGYCVGIFSVVLTAINSPVSSSGSSSMASISELI